jgi:hypothetical protein
MTGPITQERRDALVLRIGELWHGDWTGTTFDGRDGQQWLFTAIQGDDAELDSLARTLTDIEDSYL